MVDDGRRPYLTNRFAMRILAAPQQSKKAPHKHIREKSKGKGGKAVLSALSGLATVGGGLNPMYSLDIAGSASPNMISPPLSPLPAGSSVKQLQHFMETDIPLHSMLDDCILSLS